MVGKKINLRSLKEEIRKKKVRSISSAMFCQGRTTRWGLAWTYISDLDINKFGKPSTKKLLGTAVVPYTYYLPLTRASTYASVKENLLDLLKYLKVEISTEVHEEAFIIYLKASENTWINSRRKRRQEKMKKMGSDIITENESQREDHEYSSRNGQNLSSRDLENKNYKRELCNDPQNQSKKRKTDDNFDTKSNSNITVTKVLEFADDTIDCKDKNIKEYILISTIVLSDIGDQVFFELTYNDGTGGKEAANQLLQYIKNHVK